MNWIEQEDILGARPTSLPPKTDICFLNGNAIEVNHVDPIVGQQIVITDLDTSFCSVETNPEIFITIYSEITKELENNEQLEEFCRTIHSFLNSVSRKKFFERNDHPL